MSGVELMKHARLRIGLSGTNQADTSGSVASEKRCSTKDGSVQSVEEVAAIASTQAPTTMPIVDVWSVKNVQKNTEERIKNP